MLSFEDFKRLAADKSLKGYEKVGFGRQHRENTEENIFPDVKAKLLRQGSASGQKILDIGCGCSLPVMQLVSYCEEHSHQLVLVDSAEMLSNIPDSGRVQKYSHEFPRDESFLKAWAGSFDAILCYSVLHVLPPFQNVFTFVDKAVSLLAKGGSFLIGDIANVSKKRRFLASDAGRDFHRKWSNGDTVVDVLPFETHNEVDDSVILQLLMRYRSMGLETYLLPQPPGLPLHFTREDILIVRH